MEITYDFYENEVPQAAREIRQTVFIDEQGFSYEFDEQDNDATHVLVFLDGQPAATGRLFCKDGEWHIGRVAVRKELRGKHLGECVMNALCEKAKERGAVEMGISAQCRARGFYEKIGFIAHGDVYLDEYCEHIAMTKKLD